MSKLGQYIYAIWQACTTILQTLISGPFCLQKKEKSCRNSGNTFTEFWQACTTILQTLITVDQHVVETIVNNCDTSEFGGVQVCVNEWYISPKRVQTAYLLANIGFDKALRRAFRSLLQMLY